MVKKKTYLLKLIKKPSNLVKIEEENPLSYINKNLLTNNSQRQFVSSKLHNLVKKLWRKTEKELKDF